MRTVPQEGGRKTSPNGKPLETAAMAQRLIWHSTPVLTANVYTKLELHHLRGAVERLGGTHPQQNGAARQRA